MSELKTFRVNLLFQGAAELVATSQEEAENIALFLVHARCGTLSNHDGAMLMREQLPEMEYRQAKHYDEIRMGGIWHIPDKDEVSLHQRKTQRPFLDGQILDRVGFPHDDDSEEPPDGGGG